MIFNLFSIGYRKCACTKNRYLKLSKKNTSNELIRYGEDMANAKRYDEALTLFEKAIRLIQTTIWHGEIKH